MTTEIKISVIIPTYNREKLIGRAIESVLAQTRKADEIIIVDDGSTDHTGKMVQNYSKDIKYIFQENKGGAAARNTGIENAQYEWIAFLDSDDYWLENHLEKMEHAISETNMEANLYFADIQMSELELNKRLWDICDLEINSDFLFIQNGTPWVLKSRQPMMLQSSVISKKAILDIGGLNEQLRRRHDTHLFFKLCLCAPICAVNNLSTIRTIDDNSNRLTMVWDQNSKTYHNATVLLYEDILEFSKSLNALNIKDVKTLKRHLAHGYLGLVKDFIREKDYQNALTHFISVIKNDPLKIAVALKNTIAQKFMDLK